MKKITIQVLIYLFFYSITYSQGCYYAINLPSSSEPKDHKWINSYYIQACSNATITLIATPNNICTATNPVYWFVGSRNGSTSLTNIGYSRSITFQASAYSGKRISIRKFQTSSTSDHYVDIDINTSWIIPSLVKAQASSTSICSGSSVTLTGAGDAAKYVWSDGSTTDFPYNGVPFTPTSTKTYTVTGTSVNGCFKKDAITVEIKPLVGTAGTISGSSPVCQGQNSVTYTTPLISNATSYIWSLPPGAVGSSTTNSITIDYSKTASSGNLRVTGSNSCGQGGFTSSTNKVITVNALPAAAGVVSGAASVCLNQQNTYNYSVPVIANATSYVWTLPSGASGTSTTNSISVNYGSSASTGNMLVRGLNSCGEGNSSSLSVSVKSAPAIPGIVWNGFQLATDITGVAYQWYLNDNPISGGNSSVYTPNVNGVYKVVVTLNDCSTSSQGYNLTTTSIAYENALSDIGVKIYPNPVQNDLTIKCDKTPNGAIDILLLNNTGVVVRSIKTRNIQTVLNVQDLPAGSYILKIMDRNINLVNKINILR